MNMYTWLLIIMNDFYKYEDLFVLNPKTIIIQLKNMFLYITTVREKLFPWYYYFGYDNFNV